MEVTRRRDICDDEMSLLFKTINNQEVWVDDDNKFYTLEELKALDNDGMPKQGEMIEARDKDSYWCDERKFICMYK